MSTFAFYFIMKSKTHKHIRTEMLITVINVKCSFLYGQSIKFAFLSNKLVSNMPSPSSIDESDIKVSNASQKSDVSSFYSDIKLSNARASLQMQKCQFCSKSSTDERVTEPSRSKVVKCNGCRKAFNALHCTSAEKVNRNTCQLSA